MSRLKQVLKLIKDNYAFLASEFSVKRIGVYGSVAKETDSEESDVDLVVELNKPIGFKFIELTVYLENLMQGKVDIITPEGIENIRVKEIAHSIKKDIIYV